MNDRYVLLTGAKNNAGDFLIGHRARALLGALRPDRAFTELPGWEPLGDHELDVVNRSKALVLTGGPALQRTMASDVYRLAPVLDRIHVPVVSFGIGWKSPAGRWSDTRSYPLSDGTVRLLDRIDASGHASSVRDYHTLNVLQERGYRSFVMTGCPALYELDHVGGSFDGPVDLQRVTFSLGVGFLDSRSMERQMKDAVLRTRDAVAPAALTLAFHHGVDASYLDTPGATPALWHAHRRLLAWAESEGLAHADVSGGVEKLLRHYGAADLHVGYRVHAHILMSSLSKPSILIAEDGRGTALRDVLGGIVLTAHRKHRSSLWSKVLGRLGVPIDRRPADPRLTGDLARHLANEREQGYPRLGATRTAIDRHYPVMSDFLRQLP